MGNGDDSQAADNLGLLQEIEALRVRIEDLLADGDGGVELGRAKDNHSTDRTGGQMSGTSLETNATALEERLCRIEAIYRSQLIRNAARFAADVRIANGRAPLGWDGESRCAFEEEVRKLLAAELKDLDQDEANALALTFMEVVEP